ncbi:MAG: aromatic amino acid lyase, partial [Deltaproteobacteria bacterium]
MHVHSAQKSHARLGDAWTLETLESVARGEALVELPAEARHRIDRSRKLVDDLAARGDAAPNVYGVNTGFGALAETRIAADQVRALQRNLVRSHACGVGPLLPREAVRAMMALRAQTIAMGFSGARAVIVELLVEMLNRGVCPCVPSQGSVGASGDLAPLAHMTAVMIGHGEARLGDTHLPGAEALARAGIAPLALGPKEGLALINGTQFSTACALAALFEARRNTLSAIVTSALSTDAIMGSTAPLAPEIHSLRGHRGQIAVADMMRSLMAGSAIRESHREGDTRVQDPYCIRCQPQVTGAAMDLIDFAAATLETEANAVTDNPLVLASSGEIVSGG